MSGRIDSVHPDVPDLFREFNSLMHTSELGSPGTGGYGIHQSMLHEESYLYRTTHKPLWHKVEYHRHYYAIQIEASNHLLRTTRDNGVESFRRAHNTVRNEMTVNVRA